MLLYYYLVDLVEIEHSDWCSHSLTSRHRSTPCKRACEQEGQRISDCGYSDNCETLFFKSFWYLDDVQFL